MQGYLNAKIRMKVQKIGNIILKLSILMLNFEHMLNFAYVCRILHRNPQTYEEFRIIIHMQGKYVQKFKL